MTGSCYKEMVGWSRICVVDNLSRHIFIPVQGKALLTLVYAVLTIGTLEIPGLCRVLSPVNR